MIEQLWRAPVVAAVSISLANGAWALQVPRLPLSVAKGANDLQRASWACESGAPALRPASAAASTVGARYFLTGGGEAGTGEPPLILVPGKLTGFGWLSDNRGWSVIRFQCSLAPDLRQATAFSFSVVAKAAAPNGDPTAPDMGLQTSAKARTWEVRPSMAMLAHSVEETDDRDFRADCIPHSGRVSFLLTQTVPWLKKDGFVVVTIGDGTRSAAYVARAKFDNETSAFAPEVSTPADDPLFTWMASGSTLLINIGRDVAYSLPLAGAAHPVKAFAAVCRL